MRAKDVSSKAQHFFPSSLRRQVRRNLLRWFDRHQRDLPWRRDRDPYHIWVSEVMLQQTQVATVLRYFEPFIRAFPTIKDLAAASEQSVLCHWEGMGYYARAGNLQQAARKLAADHAGRIPNDPDVFGSLPGVGRYIIGAVLSQAFDRRLPILEANSRRVLLRLLGQRSGLASTRDGVLWQAAEVLLPHRRVGDFNQALMELGALICSPSDPRCDACPLTKFCEARRLGLQEEIPGKSPTPPEKVIQEVGVVVCKKHRILLVQRPTKGRWAGMWEFPHDQIRTSESLDSAARRITRKMLALQVRLGPELLTLKHSVNQDRITLVCYEGEYRAGNFQSKFYQNARWLYLSQLQDFPVSAPQRKLARILQGARQRTLF
jgi:A/G-specific adenine glycosylase